jgi:hypothetical protein
VTDKQRRLIQVFFVVSTGIFAGIFSADQLPLPGETDTHHIVSGVFALLGVNALYQLFLWHTYPRLRAWLVQQQTYVKELERPIEPDLEALRQAVQDTLSAGRDIIHMQTDNRAAWDVVRAHHPRTLLVRASVPPHQLRAIVEECQAARAALGAGAAAPTPPVEVKPQPQFQQSDELRQAVHQAALHPVHLGPDLPRRRPPSALERAAEVNNWHEFAPPCPVCAVEREARASGFAQAALPHACTEAARRRKLS